MAGTARPRPMSVYSRWYQASQSSHCIHWMVLFFLPGPVRADGWIKPHLRHMSVAEDEASDAWLAPTAAANDAATLSCTSWGGWRQCRRSEGVLRTFVQYLIKFYSWLETASDVISGKFVGPIVPDKPVKILRSLLNSFPRNSTRSHRRHVFSG